MENFDYSKITKVEELYRKDLVNEYLDLGWKILIVNKMEDGAFYSLGWEGPDPKFPKTLDPSLFGRQG